MAAPLIGNARPRHRGALHATVIFLIGLLISLGAARYAQLTADRQAQDQFDFRVTEIIAAIDERMSTYEQVLRGGVGLFDAVERVDRRVWSAYVGRLRIEEDYPGIQGVGFSQLVSAADLESHERDLRDRRGADYAVWPAGDRPFYSAIILLEPLDWRNQRAIGFDMFNEPVRREAMWRALETGRSALSGRVTLVQETEDDVQPGVLLYLPVYAGGGVPETQEERRAQLLGWVYSPFRMHDLMHGVLGQSVDDVRLQIFDGLGLDSRNLMYDSKTDVAASLGRPATVTSLRFAGHSWTVQVTAREGFAADVGPRPAVALAVGLALSFLLSLLVWNLASTRGRALALAQDMTAALRQSEERFRVALKDTNIAVFNQDAELRYTWVFNPGHGIRPERVIGKTDYELPVPQDFIQLKRRVLREGVALHRELETQFFGEDYVLALTLEPLWEDGRVAGLTAAAVDITSLKQAQRELRESEQRFRTMFENAAIGIVLTDPWEGRVIAANPAFQEMLGYSEAELEAMPPRAYVHPEDRAPIDKVLEQLARSPRSIYKRQKRYLPRDGGALIGSLTASLIRDLDGRPRYILWMVEDVSELRSAEERLRRAYAQLEQRVQERTLELQRRSAELERSNAELEQFAYVASHDLQEPLRTVASFAQLLERRYGEALDTEGRQYLGYIVAGSQRMRDLIQDLLTFSRVGAQPPANQRVELERLLANVLENLYSASSEAGAVISHDPLPTVQGDPGELSQLLQNLIANAIKFRGPERPRIHIGVSAADDEWRFSVCDNGIGVAPEQFRRIFTIFHRLHLDDRYPGTGIGLAICKKIVGRHGGRIWVESEPGKGACFWFSLRK